jgi:hypothetical protein
MIGQRVLTRFAWLHGYCEECKKLSLFLELRTNTMKQVSSPGTACSTVTFCLWQPTIQTIAFRIQGPAEWDSANRRSGCIERSLRSPLVATSLDCPRGRSVRKYYNIDRAELAKLHRNGSDCGLHRVDWRNLFRARSNTISWIYSGLAKCNGNGEDEKRVLQWAKLDFTSPSSWIPGAEVTRPFDSITSLLCLLPAESATLRS